MTANEMTNLLYKLLNKKRWEKILRESKNQKLGLWQNIMLGLGFMEPAFSLLATFSLVLVAGYSWAAAPLAYLVAGIVSIITAVSFAELVKAYPKGGSIWTFGANSMGRKFGQFSVWIYFLEVIVVPAAALIPVGFFALDWLGISPWITVLISVLIIVGLAIRGTTLSFRAILGLFLVEIGILVAFAISSVIFSVNLGTFGNMAGEALTPAGSLFGWAGIMIGATVAIFSYIGFESSANMVEETESPTRNIPRAIIISAIAGTVLYTFLAWAFVLAIPSKGLFTLQYYINPVPAMAAIIWGSGYGGIIDLAGMIGGFTAALASVTAGSRLLQKLGEDKIIPSSFQKTHNKYITPIFAILFMGLLALILGEFAPWEVVVYTVAVGAIPVFIITNFLAFWHYMKKGFGIKNIIVHAFLPWAGIALCSWFIAVGLPVHMQMLLILWMAIGVFLVFLNKALRPQAFAQEKGGRVSKKAWVGVGLSIVVLAIVALGFNLWFTFFSGGILWWYVVAPYALSSIIAVGFTLVFVVAFVGLMWYSLRKKEVEVAK
jgi:putrescine importer